MSTEVVFLTLEGPTTGIGLEFNGAPVYCVPKRQSLVTTSSSEAEYVALLSSIKNILWFRRLFFELSENESNPKILIPPETIFTNNTSKISLLINPHNSERNKHIDLNTHYANKLLENNTVSLVHMNSCM